MLLKSQWIASKLQPSRAVQTFLRASQTEHSGHEQLCGAVNFRSCEVRSEDLMPVQSAGSPRARDAGSLSEHQNL